MVLTQALIDKLVAWQRSGQGHWYYLGFGDLGAYDSQKMQEELPEGLMIMTLWVGNKVNSMGIEVKEGECFKDYDLLLKRAELRWQLAEIERRIARKETEVA